MFITFITIFAFVVFIGVTLQFIATFVEFSKLTPVQQLRAKITIKPLTCILWVASLAWIIAWAIN